MSEILNDSTINFDYSLVNFKIYDLENKDYDIWDIFGVPNMVSNDLFYPQFKEIVEYSVQKHMDRTLNNLEWSVSDAYYLHTQNAIFSPDEASQDSQEIN